MFSDPNIDAIFCARGGYGANRVLPLLDYDLIQSKPKIIMGYSDITAFLTSITQKTGLVTFHGPMLSTFKNTLVPYNLDTLVNVLSGKEDIRIVEPNELKSMVNSIRNIEKALSGSGIKEPSKSELKNKQIIRKSIIALKSITKGEIFNNSNIFNIVFTFIFFYIKRFVNIP